MSNDDEGHKSVSSIERSVALIDADELAKLMIKQDVGVTEIASHGIKRVDDDYFREDLYNIREDSVSAPPPLPVDVTCIIFTLRKLTPSWSARPSRRMDAFLLCCSHQIESLLGNEYC